MKNSCLNCWARFSLLLLLLSLAACTTAPPRQQDNICEIFREKKSWYKKAKKASDKWKSPISTMMAIMHQESRFKQKAKPPRKKILGLIPGPRPSSSYGYSQAKKETWRGYIRSSGNYGADRDDFGDAIDFIGWYNNQSYKRSKIKRSDTYHLYLAYHEGHGGFNRRTFKKKAWLKTVAKKVSKRANRYRSQLKKCEKSLRSPWWKVW